MCVYARTHTHTPLAGYFLITLESQFRYLFIQGSFLDICPIGQGVPLLGSQSPPGLSYVLVTRVTPEADATTKIIPVVYLGDDASIPWQINSETEKRRQSMEVLRVSGKLPLWTTGG